MRGDAAAIAQEMQMIWQKGSVHELRIILRPGRTVSGYYDNLEAFARDAAEWDGKASGIYLTLNPVNPALLARASNHAKDYARSTTTDRDIARRTWIPFDFDPKRPTDVSSTDEEHEAALLRARDCARWLVAEGVPRGSLVLADSGNGGHVLCRVELPNDDASTDLVKRCLTAAALRFSNESVGMDVSMFNASRIWKVYGSHACKGDNVPERPHRQARVLVIGS